MSLRSVAWPGSSHAPAKVISGEATDSLIFFPIAFLGVLTVKEMFNQMLFQFILKTLFELILIPVIVPMIKKLKAYEGADVYDQDISYGIFDVFRKK